MGEATIPEGRCKVYVSHIFLGSESIAFIKKPSITDLLIFGLGSVSSVVRAPGYLVCKVGTVRANSFPD